MPLPVCSRAVRRSNCFHMHEADLAAANASGDGPSSLCQVFISLIACGVHSWRCHSRQPFAIHRLVVPDLKFEHLHALCLLCTPE